MTTSPAPAPIVALYLDTFLSRPIMAHVVGLCRDLDASLLCLAPPPGALALARLEPHLGELARAGVEWALQPVEGDPDKGLGDLTGVARLVCGSGSALARCRRVPPVPLLIMLDPLTPFHQAKAAPETSVDWLAPRFHRGF